jgi:HEAT repeat protein
VDPFALEDVSNAPGDGVVLQTESENQAQERSRTSGPTRVANEQALRSVSPQERAQAACAAGRQSAIDAIPMLVSMLGDDSKTEPLNCWTDGNWNPALATFKQPSPGEQAAIALASMGRPAFAPLTDALGSANSSVRRNAAWAIGELTNMPPNERDDAVVPLISLLSESDPWVRIAAARALGELRDERASERLIAALLDSEAGVRQTSAWALGEMKDERAVQTLCNVLVSDIQSDVRLAAAEALGEIRSQKALVSLNQALNDFEPRVRARAKWAISEIEDSDG